MKLADKVAIITGAAAGIGAASARLFASEGARVVLVDVDGGTLETVAAVITSVGNTCAAVTADASKRLDVDSVVRQTLNQFGQIDILFNNAGIVPVGRVDVTTEEEWDRSFSINVKSMYLFCHAVIPLFRQQGGGVILNTASATALRSVTDRACYTATKGAALALTKSMALDHIRENIRVNCLCPGTIDTPSLGQRLAAFADPAEARKAFVARQPLGRLGTAEEVAAAALYLVSPESAFVTGAAFSIDGGFSI